MVISVLSYACNAYQTDFSDKSQGKQDFKDTASTLQPGDADQTAATEQSLLSSLSSSSALSGLI